MSEQSKIPIKNIYYMLCYAWNVLDQSERVNTGSEKFDNIYNLLGSVYINGVNSLLKQGLNRYYKVQKKATSSLRGKMKIGDSIKQHTFSQGRMVCEYENFEENIILNQIVKKTINILLKSPNLNVELKQQLSKQRQYFREVEDIRLSLSLFQSLRYNRNNYHYRMLMNVSELIYMGLVSTETDNDMIFLDFIRDQQMAKLYEKFVLNFYRYHLDGSRYRIHSPKIKWNVDESVTEQSLSLLPNMKTDIVIEDKWTQRQLIMDTKFYSETLVSSNHSDIEKVRTGHLYQIYAYIMNSDFPGRVNGMLLYPTVNEEVDAKFPMSGDQNIWIRTLDLSVDWEEVKGRLLEFVD
ncbi:hypothetical protein GLW08_15000 [Pontibacillus yanchengensis]|uniref:Uncharacterized protein n=1 Tax=Pontibacillus yanchengensis TaxID=462910 RepID=A0ACC7VI43_9BACI|nr:hypothetical protein [Pontibacillus yanchengensis]MYL54641.1 hypothetical protein [Pontibacillus yanchengensis]